MSNSLTLHTRFVHIQTLGLFLSEQGHDTVCWISRLTKA